MENTIENLLATFRTSGLTQEVFCKEHGVLWRSHKRDLSRSLKLPLFIAQICKNYMSAKDIHRTGV
jgi:hypothetical protein